MIDPSQSIPAQTPASPPLPPTPASPKRRVWLWLALALVLACAAVAVIAAWRLRGARSEVNFAGAQGSGGIASLHLPTGFQADVFAEGLSGPRFIAFGPDGVLYAADRDNNRIVALPDADGDGKADTVRVFADNLKAPHSLIYHEDAWYAGLPTGVVRLQDTNGDGVADRRTTLIDDYPTDGHNTRTVEFLPDGRMVVSVGSSCNVCQENDPRRAAILVYDGPETAGERVFARGLRNAVGLAVHPESGELWATNNGRDMMGDDLPPETVYIVRDGGDYGWPRCHSGHVEDPEFGSTGSCEGVDPPVVEMTAHSAPLGLTFYTGDAFPETYRGDLFVALHGSWNRSQLSGYKVVRIPLDGSRPAGPFEDFATGWLDDQADAALGRPVGLAVGPDGALYVSDDKGGYVYRISYSP